LLVDSLQRSFRAPLVARQRGGEQGGGASLTEFGRAVVHNHLTGRPLDHGIKDYDLAYFDASDPSYEAGDLVIRQVRAAFNEPLRSMVEVRNQARVHLWFEAKFGEPYPPLSYTAKALERFTSATFAVGVRLEPDDRLHIEAPFGLTDLFALRLRLNPRRKTVHFASTATDVQRRWPELVIDERGSR
jgi:uncharacterized protein